MVKYSVYRIDKPVIPPCLDPSPQTGANGISGHAIIEHLIRTPESEWSASKAPTFQILQIKEEF